MKSLSTSRHIFLCPCFHIRLQLQRNLSQLPVVQISAALLGVQRPLFCLQGILELKHQHGVGNLVILADQQTVMSVHNSQFLIHDQWGIAAVLQNILFQCLLLLLGEGRQEITELREHCGRFLR